MIKHHRRLEIALLLSVISFLAVESPIYAVEPSFPGIKDDFCFAAKSENNIYAIASDGNVWNWNGAWWWQVTSGRLIEKRICAFASDLIYGLSKGAEGKLDVYKWNGTEWIPLTVKGDIKDDFYLVSETEIYAIGQDNQVHIWNGIAWNVLTSGSLTVKDHIQATATNQVYAIGTQGRILKWNGNQWTSLTTEANIQRFFALKAENEIYSISTSQRICSWKGQSWRNITTEFACNGRIVVNSLTEIYTLGTDGMIWQWNGEKWLPITTSTTDSSNITGSTFYRVKHIDGMLESPPAILAFKDRLIIACSGIGGNIYIREWQPLRHDSWDAARNALKTGNNTWYSLNGATITTPELAVENGTLFIYAKSSTGGIYRKQYFKPYQWSLSWEEATNHEFKPGPYSSAGFAIVPSNSSGYPSPVSLVKLKDFNIIQSKPDWIKDLIIYEIPTKVFTSPNGPGTGTFKSTMEKVDHLQNLGVTAIWVTGHSWSDPRHYANIYTQYANIHPALLDPSFGSDPSDTKKTEWEFSEFVRAAHERGIKVILDVVTHGVMSYSPLASKNCTFPSYVNGHPLQSAITPHPDWFGDFPYVAFDDAIPAEADVFHDPKCFPCDTKMINYVGGYEQTDLDDWWVDVWTKYVLDYGIDGLKLDLGSSRFDLWARIKENAHSAGHELIIIPEGDMDDYPFDVGIYDVELVSYEWISFAPKFENRIEPAFGITIQDMKRAKEEIFPLLNRQYFIIPISIHDSPSYNLQGSRFKMGYGSIFTPFIPMFIAGEEFNNPLPDCTTPPWGWLLGSTVQWDELNKPQNKLFYNDMKKAISIRKSEPALNYFSPQGNSPNVVIVENFTSSLQKAPTPCLRFIPNSDEAILIAGNNDTTAMAEFSISVPLSQVGLDDHPLYRIKDLWNNRETIAFRQDMDNLTVTVIPDNFRILKISPYRDPTPIHSPQPSEKPAPTTENLITSAELQPIFSWYYVVYGTAAAILIAATFARVVKKRKKLSLN